VVKRCGAQLNQSFAPRRTRGGNINYRELMGAAQLHGTHGDKATHGESVGQPADMATLAAIDLVIPIPATVTPCAMLLAFHKPYGVLSQFTPEPGSRWSTLADFGLPPRVYPIGRLDADSEGLLLLSDEPGLNHRLLEPKYRHRREYWAQVEGIPSTAALQRLGDGSLSLDGRSLLPARATCLAPAPQLPPRDPPIRVRLTVPDTWISLELTEGRNRQVRRMTAAVGHPTLRLLRVRVGDFRLGSLAAGRWHELSVEERARVFAA
jgi:23S rRNA pseudouridine2457 synthase